jgi:DMSO reductase anchor subunit
VLWLLVMQIQVALALLLAVFLLQWLGQLAERWLFFAEAQHPQNLYYQKMA